MRKKPFCKWIGFLLAAVLIAAVFLCALSRVDDARADLGREE